MLFVKMGKYGKSAALALCLAAAVALGTAGCTRETEEPVIAERTEALAETAERTEAPAETATEGGTSGGGQMEGGSQPEGDGQEGTRAGDEREGSAQAGSGNQARSGQPWSGRKMLVQQTDCLLYTSHRSKPTSSVRKE